MIHEVQPMYFSPLQETSSEHLDSIIHFNTLTQQIKQFTFKKGLDYLNTAVSYPALNTQGEEGVTYHDSHTTSIHPLV